MVAATTTNSLLKLLFTNEDHWNVHKLIGVACLLSYAIRMTAVASDMGFRSSPQHTLLTVLLHTMLHVTSFQFKIPSRRIKGGTRIWPEYRWHSLCFALRNLLMISLFWYEQTFGSGPLYWASELIVFGNMAAVDIASAYQRGLRSDTIRNLDTPRYIKYLFSSQQFLATSTFLFGPRCYSIHFMNALIIQITPFIMTLQRKNLVSPKFVMIVYGSLLIGAFLIGTIPFLEQESFTSILVMAEVGKWAFLWRTNLILDPILRNKFLIWVVLTILIRTQLRAWKDQEHLQSWQIQLMAFTTVLVVVNGYFKCIGKSYDAP